MWSSEVPTEAVRAIKSLLVVFTGVLVAQLLKLVIMPLLCFCLTGCVCACTKFPLLKASVQVSCKVQQWELWCLPSISVSTAASKRSALTVRFCILWNWLSLSRASVFPNSAVVLPLKGSTWGKFYQFCLWLFQVLAQQNCTGPTVLKSCVLHLWDEFIQMVETNRTFNGSILALLPILFWNKVIFKDFDNLIYT